MIPIIILAAGMSTRFPGNKLLYKINDKPLIRIITENALNSKADKVVIVVGYEADKVMEALRNLPVDFVYNENYEKGMSTSVKKGVKHVMDIAKAIIIHPADVFFVPPKVFNMVIDYYNTTKAKIVVAGYKGQKGHPILFSSEIFKDIMEISEKTMGLKLVTRKYRKFIHIVETNIEEVLIDIDTLEDLNKYLKKK